VSNEKAIDTANKFIVSLRFKPDATIVLGRPAVVLTPDDALTLAAWLVAIAEPHAKHHFPDVLAAVEKS
jgi:hypothetical protein